MAYIQQYTSCPYTGGALAGTVVHGDTVATVKGAFRQTFPVCSLHLPYYQNSDYKITMLAGNPISISNKPTIALKFANCCGWGEHAGEEIILWEKGDHIFVFPACEKHAKDWYADHSLYEKCPLDANFTKPVSYTVPKPKHEVIESTTCQVGNGALSGLSGKEKKHSKVQYNVTHKEYNTTYKKVVCQNHIHHYKEIKGYTVGEKIGGDTPLKEGVIPMWHMIYRERGAAYHYIINALNAEEAKANLKIYLEMQHGRAFAKDTLSIATLNEVKPKSYLNGNAVALTVIETER